MGSCSFPPSIIFADGSAFCAGGGTGLFSVGFFSSAAFAGGLISAPGFSVLLTGAVSLPGILAGASGFFASTDVGGIVAPVFPSGFLGLSSGMTFAAGFSGGLAAAPGFSALLTGAASLPLTLPGVFAGVSGFFTSADAGGVAALVFSSGFWGPFSGMSFSAGFSGGLAVIPGFSTPLTGAVSLPLTLPGVFAGVSGFFASAGAGGIVAPAFPSGFLGSFSGMTFSAGFSGGLAVILGFSALLTGMVSLPLTLPGAFNGASGFFASAGAGGDLTDASGFFTSPAGTVSLRLSLPAASAFLTSAGGGLTAPVLSSGFLDSAAEAGFMPSFLSGGFSVLGGAFGSFAASGFFSGAGCLLRFAFSSGIVFLLHRKMGI